MHSISETNKIDFRSVLSPAAQVTPGSICSKQRPNNLFLRLKNLTQSCTTYSEAVHDNQGEESVSEPTVAHNQ